MENGQFSEYGSEAPVGGQPLGVQGIYQGLIKKGYSAKDAAREAQSRTGLSVVTGKPIKQRGPKHKTKRKWIYGESQL